MEKKRLTILFTPLNGWGATNAGTGLGQELLSRGHRVVWAIDKSFKNKLVPFGFEEECYGSLSEDTDSESWPSFMERTGKYISEGPYVVAQKFAIPAFHKMFLEDKEMDEQYRHIIEKVRPDVIIVDRIVSSPALINSGIPWVWLKSSAPHSAFNDKRLPPAFSGLPSNGDHQEWERFTQVWNNSISGLFHEINEFQESKGAPKLTDMLMN